MQNTLFHFGTIIVVSHLLGIIAACHAIMQTRTSQGAIAWAISLLAIPYFTLIPYLFLGRSKFAGYISARRLDKQHFHAHTQHHTGANLPTAEEIALTLLGAHTVRALTALAKRPLTGGNHTQLLLNGEATFTAIFAAIQHAQHYVIVQFFLVRDDALGQALKDILLTKAAQGVAIYFLYDGIGSHDLPGHYIQALRAGGVQIHAFSTRQGFVNRFQLNFRNHRKIVVVDGQQAFVGGHNVGVEYLGRHTQLSPWRDTHLRIQGPAVADIQNTFVEDWYWATRTVPHLRQSERHATADMICQVIATGPADHQETCSLFFVTMINAARERIWLTSPYFIPDEAVAAALRLAVMRGVEVRLLIPCRRDHIVVFQASTLYAHEAVHAGIQVYRYRPGFLHQKILLIDSIAAAVGSANLDNRSFRLNFEIIVLTIDTDFSAQVARMLAADFSNAVRISPNEYFQTRIWRRIIMHLAKLFSPIL